MHVQTILQNYIGIPLEAAHIRKTQRGAIIDIATSLLNNAYLTPTSLGRHMLGEAYVKHKIKRVDRWLSNQSLYSNIFGIYKAIFSPLLAIRNELHVIVDWSGCCNWSESCLRASLLYDGRSITIYQEIYSTKKQQKPSTHKQFLKNLSLIIPADCKVVIITDRGFQVPWFKAVLKLGWDFIGRISKSHHFNLNDKSGWKPVSSLFRMAGKKPSYIGAGGICKTNPLEVYLHSYKGKIKGRKAKKTRNKSLYSHLQKSYSAVYRMPWILVTSVTSKQLTSKKIVKLYQARMQIEQNFRDDKNERWGFGMQYHRSGSKERIGILLLIAAIASFILMLIGITAEKMSLNKIFQANTSKRRVLSFLFLAKQILLQFKNIFSLKDIRTSFNLIAEGAS